MNAGTLRTGLVALTAALLGGTTAAWASHQFSDVPDTAGYHDEIGEIVDAGCATGFDDGTFRPRSATLRGQFAFWLNNCAGRVAFDEGSTNFSATTSTAPDVATAAMTSGARGVGTSMALVLATIEVTTSGDQQSTWTLDRSANGATDVTVDDAILSVVTPSGVTTDPSDTVTLMAFEPMGSGDTYTFSVSGTRESGVPLANIEVELAVTTYPFDGNGEASAPPT